MVVWSVISQEGELNFDFNFKFGGRVMDQGNNVVKLDGFDFKSLGKKSWTAYVKIFFWCTVLLVICVPMVWSFSKLFGAIVLFIVLSVGVYKALVLKSYELHVDEDGVWIYSGVLPWTQGAVGVKWRDLGEVLTSRSFGSWVSKSCSIYLGHRFKESDAVFVEHWDMGQEAAAEIYRRHQELVQNGLIK